MTDKHLSRGASANTTSSSDAFNAWFSHHQFSARISLQKMVAEPLSNFVTCLVIGIALALPASLFVVVQNIKLFSGNWDDNPQISVYMRQNTSSATVLSLGDKLKHKSGILSVTYISPESALAEFKQSSGFGDALKLLDENPLPPVYIVKPIATDPGTLTMLSLQLKAIPEVEYVQLDMEWVKRLQQILNLAERFIFLFGFLLCLGVALTIGNSIRLAIEKRREEIVVIKLVGGTNAFVRRPLLYSGLWYGLFGGALAIALVQLATYLLTAPSQQLAVLYQSEFSPKGLALSGSLALLVVSILLGLSGAWLATTRHLQQVQPH